ncbi:MAG: Multi-sensor hybrid histidine kinase [Candidatus Kaiserbacteria bacterium GW2011_GWC2_52_8b]|uniref:histidine kinase n=2 Tax=Candidatus Kaiseribacteriota TaxID=1752734 RepID=A0A0G2AER6_9BACT|nr:MAG: Multi-sensor hybrid histidine kinase [Candidatus Kaiserbacteria bacterium GW2011_GWA2_52_12]KKW30989.1 MAG: Multi-sensor hybrid histidine kinase [Candidatus Kaiserbacteria bacterium GW2011_GWC2_52_8b]
MAYVVKASPRRVSRVEKPDNTHVEDAVFRSLVGASPRPVLITNDRAQIIYVNTAWEHVTGYTLAEVIGKNPRILKSGKTSLKIYDEIRKKLISGQQFVSSELINRKKNGRLFNLYTMIFPVSVGTSMYYVQIFEDVTIQKHAEEYRSTFLKTAAHDMRTPLSSLAIMSEMLALHSPNCSKEATDLHEEVIRLQELATSLLDMREFENGKMILERVPIDLGALVKETVDTAQGSWQDHLIEIESPLDVFADADKVRVRRVLMNLLDNALRHASESSPIHISLKKDDSNALVSVKNHGSYIPRDQRKDIFKSFYKIGTKSKGYGLGLYIASEIIHAHGGKIWVESRERNPYTAFHFTLPLVSGN